MKNYNWDRFYLHMYYHSTLDKVFKSWATPNGQASFFVMECNAKRNDSEIDGDSFFQPGDSYEYLWEDSGKSKGEIINVDHENYIFSFTFDVAKIQIKLKEDDLGVLLELKHYDIPKDYQELHQLDCRVGWTHFLVNLKCVLEKSADIRETNYKCAGTLGWGINPPSGIILD